MHNVIGKRMGLCSEIVDHEDLDKLNNRRENLRAATKGQNNSNRDAQSNNVLGLKGVSYKASRGKYYANIKIGTKTKYLGSFNTAEEAAAAYAKAAKEEFGEYART